MSKGTYFPSGPDSPGPGLRKLKEHPLEVPAATTPSSPELQEPGGGRVLQGRGREEQVSDGEDRLQEQVHPRGCTASHSLGEDLRCFCKL